MADMEIPDTPLMQQYVNLKKSYPDAFLFFRLGDFFEMFFEDALKGSALLGLTLTHRQKVPMCGVPHHSCTNYIHFSVVIIVDKNFLTDNTISYLYILYLPFLLNILEKNG